MVGFLFCNNIRLEIVSDVVSGVAVVSVGMDVHVKFCDFRSNGSRDIRGANCVSNEQTNEHDRGLSHKAETSCRHFA